MVPKLAEHCKARGVTLMASAFSEEMFRLIDPFVSIHKIASPELHDPTLVKLAASSEKPTLLSTGLSTLEEIAWAVDLFQKSGGRGLTLLQCTVQYPTDPTAAHLHVLKTLSQTFSLPVGLSDHTRDPLCAPIAAVGLGAKVVEKHFTLHNRLVGPDHVWAITGEELKEMVQKIRLAEQMLGDSPKGIVPEEEALRTFSRRSIQAICHIPKGTSLQLGKNIAILRPGTQLQGLHPRYLEDVEGKMTLRDIDQGTGILEQDFA